MNKRQKCWRELLYIFGLTTKDYWIIFFTALALIIFSTFAVLAFLGPQNGFVILGTIIYLCNLPFIPFTYSIFKQEVQKMPNSWCKFFLTGKYEDYWNLIVALFSPIIFIYVITRYIQFKKNLKNNLEKEDQ